MKFEDCKVGMKLRRVGETIWACKQGEIYTVSDLIDHSEVYPANSVAFEEISSGYELKFFEPANKFKVGDEVIWTDDECIIWGKHFEEDEGEYEYALQGKNKNFRMMIYESKLSPAKKPNELEVGDKFKSKTGITYQILCVAHDDSYGKKEYYYKVLSGISKGETGLLYASKVSEMIYDEEK